MTSTTDDQVDLDALPAAARADLPRAHHYGEFYGLKPLPDDGRPFLLVHGNCQAESLRLLLQDAPEAPCASVRIPAVHEIAADEVPFLERLLRRCDVLVVQPIADGYHDLPLGTGDVTHTAALARTVVFPVFRFVGLFPYQVVTGAPDLQPPVVPYHDLRTLLRAAGRPAPPALDAATVEAVTRWSLDELRRREEAAGTLPVHDLVRAAGTRAANTINHPGNPVLVGLARRVQAALGWPQTATDPGFELLDSVHTPLEPAVRDAVDPSASVRADWLVGGEAKADASVADEQLAWYANHPEAAPQVLARSQDQLRCLGVSW
ncbi:MAG: WcbI family polysaccharide biosynthesis putative acetyltransferase [Lapillicoccus sp.]